MHKSEIAIKVQNVSMKYKILMERIDSFKQYVIKKIKNEIRYSDFYALREVSFSVYRGEVFGIIGYNGAGKSTLLKVVSGIIKPTNGHVERIGNIAPLIELGAGFDGELTGAENIFLKGLLLGYSKKTIKEKFDEIVSFSELEQFINTPLKNYSSGMIARLGFSIATLIEPEILVVDEVLSVGDIRFREKSESKILNMMNNGTTVLFVSHSLQQIEKLCTRTLWLENGCIRKIGNTKDVIEEFKKATENNK